MDCVTPLLDPLFSSFREALESLFSFLRAVSAEQVGHLVWLEKNAEALAREMKELKEVRDDLLRELETSERSPLTRRTHRVQGWLDSVAAIDAVVVEFQASFESRTTCAEGCSLFTLHSNYQLGRIASEKLKQVRDLRSQGNFTSLVSRVNPDKVEKVPTTSSTVLGGEETLSRIRSCLVSDGVGILGIYGMGGIGKSTLLTKINNDLVGIGKSTLLTKINNDLVAVGNICSFDVVIWIVVSRDMSLAKIQKDVGDRLGLSLPEDEQERAEMLFKTLSKKRFLLFLDDVWEALDLKKVGIPLPNHENKCKIAFTTRSENVCVDMDAKEMIKVEFLNKRDSWQLFREKVRSEAILNNPSIKPLAEILVKKCGGLPLALVTVGRAMANKTTIYEWNRAMKVLKSSPNRLRGMEDVLSLLKFSYDNLENDTMRSCLLYCSLFPEDENIHREELVEYWIGEGFLDDVDNMGCSDDLDSLRNEGHYLIGCLMASCLLEHGRDDLEVKMHDAVREMALWISSGSEQNNKSLVFAGLHLTEAPRVEGWGGARRVSLMHNDMFQLPQGVPRCPNLSTLLINKNTLTRPIPDGFFRCMPALRVLDLSYTSIKELPVQIGSLVELQYLNLFYSDIPSLPKELGNLVKLRQLNLGNTYHLSSIPHEAISKLSKLQSLNMYYSCYYWISGSHTGDHGREVCVEDLKDLEQLDEIGLSTRTLSALETLCTHGLMKAMTYLEINDMGDLTSAHLSTAFKNMKRLRELAVLSCSQLDALALSSKGDLTSLELLRLFGLLKVQIIWKDEEVFKPVRVSTLQSLRRLQILGCHALKTLTWVRYLPCLHSIYLAYCDGIEELVEDDTGGGAEPDHSFPSLKSLDLVVLPEMRSICGCSLAFPSLEHLLVQGCKKLKKLPLGAQSAKKIIKISGEPEWWDGLEWDEDSTRSIFLPSFQ